MIFQWLRLPTYKKIVLGGAHSSIHALYVGGYHMVRFGNFSKWLLKLPIATRLELVDWSRRSLVAGSFNGYWLSALLS